MVNFGFAFFIGIVAGITIDEMLVGKARRRGLRSFQDNCNKLVEFYDVLIQWLKIIHNGRHISEYLLSKGYKKIAIYGMKELGVALLEDLKDTGVEVMYGIDRDAELLNVSARMCRVEDDFEPVDAVIVTAIHYFEDIERELKTKIDCPILSLEEVVFEA